MIRAAILMLTLMFIGGCAAGAGDSYLDNVEEVNASTVIDAPRAVPGRYAPANRGQVERGEYLVELLGCGACHTDGALVGEPDAQRLLAGSTTGIAFTSPLHEDNPGVVYPPNITPDSETGIGDWSDMQIADAIRSGVGRHMIRRITTMPWPGYSRISDDDIAAIVSYLRSIEPVSHRVPERVAPGQQAENLFVYFGVYRSKR
jgi:mono/diheme cytochrome c family protein